MIRFIYLIIIALSISMVAHADVQIEHSRIGHSLQDKQAIAQSKVWDITTDEWRRYKSIMQSTGKYLYKNQDPITVLGLNARSPSERDRFARLLAKQEYTNAKKLILLNRAYNKQFALLYGNIPIIDTSLLKPSTASLITSPKPKAKVRFGDRYIAFINTKCKKCNDMIKNIVTSMPIGVSLDIHFKNDSRHNIMVWAASQDISTASVRTKRITLNPDSALYKKFKDPVQPSLYLFNKYSDRVSKVVYK